jgi:cell wall-associated NlpC family hydrolase
MKCFRWLFLFVLFYSVGVFSQENYTQHTVLKGETISKIAKKYKVSPKVIYDLNPDASNGIKFNTVLNIPSITSTSKQDKTTPDKGSKNSSASHDVLPKETRYSISKAYGISVDKLEQLNPILKTEELKIGQNIFVSENQINPNTVIYTLPKKVVKEVETNKSVPIVEVKKTIADNTWKHVEKAPVTTESIEYEVLPKETKYSISIAYGITVDILDNANPILQTEDLKIGQKIIIPVKANSPNTVVTTSEKVVKKEIETPKTVSVAEVKKQVYEKSKETPIVETKPIMESSPKPVETIFTTEEGIVYEVLPKETKYSIAKRYGITVDILDNANPILQTENLKIGQKIIIPVKPYNPNGDYDIKLVKSAKNVNKEAENTVISEFKHEVLAKETKYGIAKEYEITVKELEKQNPKIIQKLTIGSTLTIRSNKVFEKEILNEEVVAEELKKENTSLNSIRDEAFLERLIETASENIGVQYRPGGTSRDGFDCSGLMCVTFENNNIQLPRTSVEQSQLGIVVNKEEARKGDLIFFKTSRRSQINHVGMVVEVVDGDIKFIHASSSGVMISSLKERYYEKRFAQINHVL